LGGHAEQLLFETMLDQFKTHGLLKARGHQRTDSTHVLAAIRTLNRLECVGETMRHALEALAIVAPAWLLQQVRPEWKERYEQRIEEYRLPASKAERQALAETIGADGFSLMAALADPVTPAWLRQVPALEIPSCSIPSTLTWLSATCSQPSIWSMPVTSTQASS
jgi:transposase